MNYNYFDLYLKAKGTNRNQIAENSGLSTATLQRASKAKHGTSSLSGHILKALATTIRSTPGEIFDQLMDTEQAIESLKDSLIYSMPIAEDTRYFGWEDTILDEKNYLKDVITDALKKWLDMDSDEREEESFYSLAEEFLYNEPNFHECTKDGRYLTADEL